MKALCATLAATFIAASTVYAQTEAYSHGDPTNDEQYMLELVNRARANPTAEGVRLMDTDDPAVQQAYSFFNINKAATKTAFAGYAVRPPLAFHTDLLRAARAHTADMIANNFQGHTSSNGDDLTKRYQKVGYSSQGMYGENVAAYSNTVWYGHCGLNVDWGEQNQIDLGHRSNIMNFDNFNYTEIGIGITKTSGGLQTGTVGPYVITQDFGLRSVIYITGVVYRDANGNNFYDQGEGVAGVKVMPDKGTYFAITSSSGGYAIPVQPNQSYSIVFSEGGVTESAPRSVNVSTLSVKLDYVPAASAPPITELLTPTNNATNQNAAATTLTWKPTATADSYAIEVATNQSFSPATIVYSGESSTTSTALPTVGCGTQYYWRVQATNGEGTGPWSTPFSFRTGGSKPSMPTVQGAQLDTIQAEILGEPKTITAMWQAAAGAEMYHVRLSSTTPPVKILWEDSTVTGTQHTITVFPLETVETNMEWSVRSKNSCGYSGWTSPRPVILKLTSVEDFTEGGYSAKVYPQPITEASALYVTSPNSLDGTVSIYSAAGELLWQQGKHFTSGNQTIPLHELQDLQAGVYFVRITIGSATSTITVVRE